MAEKTSLRYALVAFLLASALGALVWHLPFQRSTGSDGFFILMTAGS